MNIKVRKWCLALKCAFFWSKYRRVVSSRTSWLVGRLSQQHPQKGHKFKQQHVLVSSYNNQYIIKYNRSDIIPKSSKMQDPQELHLNLNVHTILIYQFPQVVSYFCIFIKKWSEIFKHLIIILEDPLGSPEFCIFVRKD